MGSPKDHGEYFMSHLLSGEKTRCCLRSTLPACTEAFLLRLNAQDLANTMRAALCLDAEGD